MKKNRFKKNRNGGNDKKKWNRNKKDNEKTATSFLFFSVFKKKEQKTVEIV